MRRNRGLGAAVRRGLAEGVARGAAAVAFCDADGEYAPEELERDGRAGPGRAAPTTSWARASPAGSGTCARTGALGNRVLTRLLSLRGPPPRSPTGRAATGPCRRGGRRDAEIVHDFNYAQVLTLDLLAKGFALRRGADQLPLPRARPLVRAARPLPAARRAGGVPRAERTATQSSDDVRRRSGSRAAGPDRGRRRSRRVLGSRRRPSAIASAWWVLSCTNRPCRPRVSRRGLGRGPRVERGEAVARSRSGRSGRRAAGARTSTCGRARPRQARRPAARRPPAAELVRAGRPHRVADASQGISAQSTVRPAGSSAVAVVLRLGEPRHRVAAGPAGSARRTRCTGGRSSTR